MAAILRVTVDGVTRADGTLHVGLYDEATFSNVPDAPLFQRELKISGDVAMQFDRLPPGAYALKAWLDVNNNGKRDAGEPQAISNNAAANDFDAAAIALMPGTNKAALHLR